MHRATWIHAAALVTSVACAAEPATKPADLTPILHLRFDEDAGRTVADAAGGRVGRIPQTNPGAPILLVMRRSSSD